MNRDGNLDIEIDDAWADAVPAVPVETPTVREFAVDTLHFRECPPLNVVMFVVGSRGECAWDLGSVSPTCGLRQSGASPPRGPTSQDTERRDAEPERAQRNRDQRVRF